MGKSVCRTCAQPSTQERFLSAVTLPVNGVAHQAESALRVPARPMRVLTLTPFYPSAEDESQGSFIAGPLCAIENYGIQNHVIAVHPFYRQRAHEIDGESFRTWEQYFSIPGNSGLALSGDFLAATLTRKICRLHAERPFDLIHAHAALPCGRAAELLSKKLRIPFFVSVHGLDAYAERQGGFFWGRWCRRKSASVYRAAQAAICVSEKAREQVAQCIGVNCVVIHNGVDADFFSPGTESTPLTVLSVGNLIPIKGHEHLLRAFAHVKLSVPGCRLELIGDGPERERLARLANELGITGRVSFKGRLRRAQVAEAMKRCAVFALPSSYESLGCVYLEAMSSGKPAIGCTGQGIGELIESDKNGMLVAPDSPAELASALRTLLVNRDLRARLGSAARATILQGNTLEHQAAHLVRLYRECMA